MDRDSRVTFPAAFASTTFPPWKTPPLRSISVVEFRLSLIYESLAGTEGDAIMPGAPLRRVCLASHPPARRKRTRSDDKRRRRDAENAPVGEALRAPWRRGVESEVAASDQLSPSPQQSLPSLRWPSSTTLSTVSYGTLALERRLADVVARAR